MRIVGGGFPAILPSPSYLTSVAAVTALLILPCPPFTMAVSNAPLVSLPPGSVWVPAFTTGRGSWLGSREPHEDKAKLEVRGNIGGCTEPESLRIFSPASARLPSSSTVTACLVAPPHLFSREALCAHVQTMLLSLGGAYPPYFSPQVLRCFCKPALPTIAGTTSCCQSGPNPQI